MIESRKEKEISLKKKISIITILSDECKMKNRLRKIMTIIGMTLMLVTVVGVNSMSLISPYFEAEDDRVSDI